MLRVSSRGTLVVPPFECAWLSLPEHQLLDGSFCLQFDCQGDNDVTIILKPQPGTKRWQHLQRLAPGAAGEAETLAVESNYTVILGSHRNSKLKIEKNGEEVASAAGLPGCTVSSSAFMQCWISYSRGAIAVGTGAATGPNAVLSFLWTDPQPAAIPDIQAVGLSCWDRHVSYRNVQLLPALGAAQLRSMQQEQEQLLERQLEHQHLHEHHQQQQQFAAGQLHQDQQQQQPAGAQQPPASCNRPGGPSLAHASSGAAHTLLNGSSAQEQQAGVPSAPAPPPLLYLVQEAIVAQLQPAAACRVLVLAELLLPRTQRLYEAVVQLAGEWFGLLARRHLQDLAGLPLDVLVDVLHEPLLDVSELDVFSAVAAWCAASSTCACSACVGRLQDSSTPAEDSAQEASLQPPPSNGSTAAASAEGGQQQQDAAGDANATACEVLGLLQLVRFALLNEQERQQVLAHPFTQRCPLVLQCLHADMQRLHEAASGAAAPAASGFHCQQRRLVLPAGDAAVASAPAAAAAGSGVAVGGLDQRLQQRDDGPSSALGSGSGGSGSRRGAGSWLRRRLAPSCKELMYVHDGDRNGVIHYIATDYGTKPWVNPVLSKALAVKASSPPSRHTDPKAIVSSHFLNTSFAGPRYVRPAAAAASSSAAAATAAPETWWQVDLGPQHRLLVNYYVMRHDGSHDGFARSWVLQGSNDAATWVDLRRHVADTTIKASGQYGSWAVAGPAASMPFRAFRLLLTEPTQSSTNPWAFCLSYWELYGWLFKLRAKAGGEKQQQQQPEP